ncbi:hypothetical protein FW754_00410 [Acinetobacter sp. 1207_04]
MFKIWSRGVQNRRNMDARMFINAENVYTMLNDAPKKNSLMLTFLMEIYMHTIKLFFLYTVFYWEVHF